MDKNLIKVIDEGKANELMSLGYKYVKETINGLTVYSFFMSDELAKYVNSRFSKKDFVLTNKLTF